MSRDVSKHFECGLNGAMEVFFFPPLCYDPDFLSYECFCSVDKPCCRVERLRSHNFNSYIEISIYDQLTVHLLM